MAGPSFDGTLPDYGSASVLSAQMVAIRENFLWLMIAAAATNYMLPGWVTAVNGANKSEPTDITMTKGSLKMQWIFVWSGGKPTRITWRFDRGLGAGWENVQTGQIDLLYNASDEFTGTTVS